MKASNNQLLYWSPRILGILIAIFVSIFALDVFGGGFNLWETAAALLMHLIPTLVIVITLLIAWRWERLGGFLFIALGVLYMLLFWDPTRWPAYLLISGPLFLAGILFLLDGFLRESSGK